jgi:Lrp/AsnC family transcriptional regulator, leucine-responsive regulatory protein
LIRLKRKKASTEGSGMKSNLDGSIPIDNTDSVLLSILQKNAELSLSEIGKGVGLTKMAVSNRIKRLKKLGIIEGSCYRLNPVKLGQDYAVISTITCNYKGIGQERVANAIARFPGVMSVYLMFGTSDILVVARRSDRRSAKKLIYDISKLAGVRNTLTMVPHTVIKESLEIDISKVS